MVRFHEFVRPFSRKLLIATSLLCTATQLFSRSHCPDRSALKHSADVSWTTVLAHAWVNYETLLENCLVGFLVRD